jgi:hypothetical protein
MLFPRMAVRVLRSHKATASPPNAADPAKNTAARSHLRALEGASKGSGLFARSTDFRSAMTLKPAPEYKNSKKNLRHYKKWKHSADSLRLIF